METGGGMALANEVDIADTVKDVLESAIKVIGDKQKAMRWLGTPIRALNFATPISVLADPGGKNSVLDVLTRLEHGVF
jgi:putative toxin-antitoxin system antitoxin component (TIGR02293 family)